MRVSHRPENSIVGAARLQRDAVSKLVADVYVHLVCNTEGQIDCQLFLDLTAHHHTVLVLRRQTELGTPLRDLKTSTHTISTWMHLIIHYGSLQKKIIIKWDNFSILWMAFSAGGPHWDLSLTCLSAAGLDLQPEQSGKISTVSVGQAGQVNRTDARLPIST